MVIQDVNKDLAMIKNPDRWPVWPLLPLIRGRVDVGVLMEAAEGYTLILANLFMMPKDLSTAKTISYKTAEDIIADGWQVD